MTQKAAGIEALYLVAGQFSTLYHRVISDESQIDSSGLADLPTNMLTVFIRPCPSRPRHGFIESVKRESCDNRRRVFVRDIWDAARAVDPEAELVLMPYITARHNMVAANGSLTIGKGHDGATAGRHAVEVFCAPLHLPEHVREKAQLTGEPFWEFITQNRTTYLVQLRDGPKIDSASVDFVPHDTRVGQVIRAIGPLEDFARQLASAAPNAVVDHAGGSISSHYGIQSVIAGIPLITSHRPRRGEQLARTTDSVSVPNLDALRAGLIYSLTDCRGRITQGSPPYG